jgi:hypothetical protein
MIQDFIKPFDAGRKELEDLFSRKHPETYKNIVKEVIKLIGESMENDPERPDFERIETIDHGDYQGTLLFIIPCAGYQPSTYWYVKISYGSCTVCDTLQGIRPLASYDEKPTSQQVADYMTLALHIVQGLRLMNDDDDD